MGDYVNAIMMWFVIILMLVLGFTVDKCNAQNLEALYLAQCIRAECGDGCHSDEPAAIAWVLKKLMLRYNNNPYNIRVGKYRSFGTQTLKYCRVFRRLHKRALAIRMSTFDRPMDGSKKWWKRIERMTTDFLDGNIEDPLPLARHWDSQDRESIALRKGFIIILRYSNTFYRCSRKR